MKIETRRVQGVTVPSIMYGTAWKGDRTEALTSEAITCGFRAIDTANQRKHYFEAAVGAATENAFTAGDVTRESLFLQTKFTAQRGQDHRLPYDPTLGSVLPDTYAAVGTGAETALGVLDPQFKENMTHLRVPPYVWATQEHFQACPRCGRIFWGATHRQHIREELRGLGVVLPVGDDPTPRTQSG